MNQEINKLIDYCIDYFKGTCYTQHRIERYKSLWKRGIILYMANHEILQYSSEIGQDFIKECISPSDNLNHDDREKIRSIQVLDDYIMLGYIRQRVIVPIKHSLHGCIGAEMQKLVNHLRDLRRSSLTIKDYELYLSYFLRFLDKENIKSVHEISEHHILKFISTQEKNKINIVGILRVLFRYWSKDQIVSLDFESILKNYKWVKKEKIPSYYTSEEVLKIELSIGRNSRSGKRNYAMLLLASRLGLRASDIANLMFSNIDWEKNEINLIQYKTKEPIILPLLVDVGNAIIDYLKYGRFKSESQHVFLSSRAPYVSATQALVCAAIGEVIGKAGVNIKHRHHGPHSMRHSLATTLLENGTSMPVISEVLGHQKTESTMIYLKIDITLLQKCALSVPVICESFYEQKGGVFYE